MNYSTLIASMSLVAQCALPASAESEGDRLDTVVVHGRGLELIGEAGMASEGVVGYADFEDRPLSRVGELVEVTPGWRLISPTTLQLARSCSPLRIRNHRRAISRSQPLSGSMHSASTRAFSSA